MDKQTKIIFALLALITIATVFLILKITGVIKPKEIKVEDIKQESTEVVNNDDKDYDYKYNSAYKESFSIKLLMFVMAHQVLVKVVSFVVTVLIYIGIGKLYAKLSMPEWCVYMQYLFPLISFTTSIPYICGMISLIIAILQVVTLAYFFSSVGMSKLWAICPTASIIIISIGIVSSSSWLMGQYNSGGSLLTIIGFISLIAFAIAYVIANVKVGQKFEKGVLFIIGLVMFPYIFKPILGYTGNSNKMMHNNYNYNI